MMIFRFSSARASNACRSASLGEWQRTPPPSLDAEWAKLQSEYRLNLERKIMDIIIESLTTWVEDLSIHLDDRKLFFNKAEKWVVKDADKFKYIGDDFEFAFRTLLGLGETMKARDAELPLERKSGTCPACKGKRSIKKDGIYYTCVICWNGHV